MIPTTPLETWSNGWQTWKVLADYGKTLLIAYEWETADGQSGRDLLTLPRRLFSEGKCGMAEPIDTGESEHE